MTELRITGKFDCSNCGKPIEIDKSVGVCNKSEWNIEHKKCPYCNYLNTITIDIRLTCASENEIMRIGRDAKLGEPIFGKT